ncbi:MAG: flagellar basal body rod protein FlgC [Lachnospiraceae bacterium]|nr:flagellar basal body rod protein FlgC [Lachnospiraceae bacterium]
MSMFSAFNVNASGMTAQRLRMDIISENVANAQTTRTEDGTPYRRKVVTFAQKGSQTPFNKVLGHVTNGYNAYSGQGVKVDGIYEDTNSEMKMVYDPAHPDADENGYVTYPNVNIVTEMTNLIDASRAYEANSTAFTASKAIALQGLQITQQ